MSFLDNLENTLKSLEKGEELVPDRKRRESEQATARASAPYAEQLKTSDWTRQLLDLAAQAAHARRAKLYIVWIGTTLRLDLRERRLELRPTPEGIVAAALENGTERSVRPIELSASPAQLLEEWLA